MRRKRRGFTRQRKNYISIAAIVLVLVMASVAIADGGLTGISSVSAPVSPTVELPAHSDRNPKKEEKQSSAPAEKLPVSRQDQSQSGQESPPNAVDPTPVTPSTSDPAPQPSDTPVATDPVPQAADTPAATDPTPQAADSAPVQTPEPEPTPDPAPSTSSGSGDINLNDSSSYAPDYSEPDVTRAMPAPGTNDDHIVYIYDTGKKYHHDPNCCGPDSHAITLEEAERLGYTQCQKKGDW